MLSVLSSSLLYFLVYVNNQKFKKVKVCTNRSSTLQQKTLPLKCLISSPLIL